MNRYPTYRHSGVDWIGEVPEHWSVATLYRCIDPSRRLTYGIVQAGPKLDVGIPYIRPADMTDEGIPSVTDLPKTSPEIAANYSRSAIQEGDIVMSIGPSFGKVAMARAEHTGANLTQGTARIAIAEEHLARYFFWLLRSSDVHQYWTSIATGATFPALNLEPLGSTVVPIPSYKEQQKIAAYLDHTTALIDQLIEKNTALLELLDLQRKAIINEAVTKGLDPKAPMKDSGIGWLGEVPKHWGISSLRYLTSKIGSGVTPRGGAAVYTESGIPFIRSQNVHFDGLRLDGVQHIPQAVHEDMSNTKVEFNDVLLNITGASIGRCCIVRVDQEMNVNQHVCILRTTSELNPEYLNLVMQSDVGQTQVRLGITGGNREGLNMEEIKGFVVPLPPIEEQRAIANGASERLDLVVRIDSMVRQSNDMLMELRTSVISEAVTGKIDLREWEPEPKSLVQ